VLISYLCVIAKAEYALSGNAINRSINTAARRFVFECRVANVVKQITSGSPSVCVRVSALFTVRVRYWTLHLGVLKLVCSGNAAMLRMRQG
jgi:hypothetical protein